MAKPYDLITDPIVKANIRGLVFKLVKDHKKLSPSPIKEENQSLFITAQFGALRQEAGMRSRRMSQVTSDIQHSRLDIKVAPISKKAKLIHSPRPSLSQLKRISQ